MDDFVVSSLINLCEALGTMFFAEFIGIDNFDMGVYMIVFFVGISLIAYWGRRNVH